MWRWMNVEVFAQYAYISLYIFFEQNDNSTLTIWQKTNISSGIIVYKSKILDKINCNLIIFFFH